MTSQARTSTLSSAGHSWGAGSEETILSSTAYKCGAAGFSQGCFPDARVPSGKSVG